MIYDKEHFVCSLAMTIEKNEKLGHYVLIIAKVVPLILQHKILAPNLILLTIYTHSNSNPNPNTMDSPILG